MKTSKFKMTELGPIPEDWEVKRLGDCGAFIGGSVFPINRQGARTGDYPFFKVSDFSNIGNESVLRYGNNYVLKSIAHELRCTIIPNQAIVFAKIGAAIALERKRMVAQDSCIDNNMMAFCVNGSADTHYFVELLRRIKFADFTESTALPAINIRRLRDCLISVPPLPEQRRIAEALSDVDALLSAMTTLIEKKRAIKQGTMQELLGMRDAGCGMRNDGSGMRNVPRRRLAGFSGEWVEKRLGEIGDFIAGNGFPLSKQGDKSGDYPFFKVSDFNNIGNENVLCVANNYISESTFSELHCSLIPSGSIVFAKIGAAIALERKRRVCYDSCIDNNMMAFCVNRQNDERFITECLRRVVFADLAESTALPALNVSKLREYKIVIPKSILEQQAIAAVLSDMDAEIAALEAKRAKYESIKQGMMQELLTGRTRLKGE